MFFKESESVPFSIIRIKNENYGVVNQKEISSLPIYGPKLFF